MFHSISALNIKFENLAPHGYNTFYVFFQFFSLI